MAVPNHEGRGRAKRRSAWRWVAWAAVAVPSFVGGLAGQSAGDGPVDHGPIRGYVFTGAQADLEPFSFDRAFGVGAIHRVFGRTFVGARVQGEDREGEGSDALWMFDAGRFLLGSMWGGAHLAAVAGSALRNGDWFWTGGLRAAGGSDGSSPLNIELELRLAGGQGDLEVWSSFLIGIAFPPFTPGGDG